MKNKKIINVICYIITAALAVFYLATLVLGSKRQVSQEYDLYYVDGKLSKWPGEHGLDYNFGDVDIYDISKLEEYKKLLEEEKLYGDPSGRNEQDDADNNEADKDSVESNRDSALDKYFQKMLAAENSNLSDNIDDKADKAGDPDTADPDSSEKSTASQRKFSGVCLCRAVERREVFPDQPIAQPQGAGQNQRHTGEDRHHQLLPAGYPAPGGSAGIWLCKGQ